ncbi:hypothetical protein FRACA_60017 [Frankia canadensis]|uniref:Uncharacterized protein n=1 Tax=Frankia canadensis TaxID=1836972 RepID=A0A2I2KZD9_9ACTN|nr:hypothetical protein FRACA_60017 [Frankia canadensis]SOU58321.1 hypothetical protein FRACA_60017 [Frankia canadensis]
MIGTPDAKDRKALLGAGRDRGREARVWHRVSDSGSGSGSATRRRGDEARSIVACCFECRRSTRPTSGC